jgi:hypothetical protein
MTRRKAIDRWETKISNVEVTPQAICPIAKTLLKWDGPRAPNALHGSSGLKFLPSEKANAIADCLEIQFRPHDLCDESHERRVEAKVQVLLETVDKTPPPQRRRLCNFTEMNNILEIQKGLWKLWHCKLMP